MSSTPFRQVTTGVADLSWDTSISNQVQNYGGAVLEIYTDSSDLTRVSEFFKEFFKINESQYRPFPASTVLLRNVCMSPLWEDKFADNIITR